MLFIYFYFGCKTWRRLDINQSLEHMSVYTSVTAWESIALLHDSCKKMCDCLIVELERPCMLKECMNFVTFYTLLHNCIPVISSHIICCMNIDIICCMNIDIIWCMNIDIICYMNIDIICCMNIGIIYCMNIELSVVWTLTL